MHTPPGRFAWSASRVSCLHSEAAHLPGVLARPRPALGDCSPPGERQHARYDTLPGPGGLRA
eukprot:3618467-Alexandrium_andersonii.AAC.1